MDVGRRVVVGSVSALLAGVFALYCALKGPDQHEPVKVLAAKNLQNTGADGLTVQTITSAQVPKQTASAATALAATETKVCQKEKLSAEENARIQYYWELVRGGSGTPHRQVADMNVIITTFPSEKTMTEDMKLVLNTTPQQVFGIAKQIGARYITDLQQQGGIQGLMESPMSELEKYKTLQDVYYAIQYAGVGTDGKFDKNYILQIQDPSKPLIEEQVVNGAMNAIFQTAKKQAVAFVDKYDQNGKYTHAQVMEFLEALELAKGYRPPAKSEEFQKMEEKRKGYEGLKMHLLLRHDRLIISERKDRNVPEPICS